MHPATELVHKPHVATLPALDCVVCGASSWTVVGSSQDFEYLTCGNSWDFRACCECGHVQIDPLPHPSTLRTIYPKDYYSYVMEQSVHPIALWAKKQLDRRKFEWITSEAQINSYLDVGCGDGRYLEMMIEQGLDREYVYGVELDSAAVAAARCRGLQVQHSRIEDASLPIHAFDLITMFHVIEHVARPDEVIARLRELLRPGGILALETPNFDCADARLAGRRYWGGYHTPRHWHIFTPSSLARLLSNHGFEVVRSRFQTGHAFLVWTLHHWLKFEKGKRAFAKLCHPLRSLPLIAAATAFDLMRIGCGAKTSAMLMVARKQPC